MSSTIQSVDKDNENDRAVANQKWAVACSSITFVVSLVVVLMHLHPVASTLIVATKAEGVLCVILIAFWSATVAIVSDSENGLAVDGNGAVTFGNLYYFSWAGFVTSVTLFVSYLRSAYHVDVPNAIRKRSARLELWAAFMTTSLVVMGSAANIFDDKCDYEDKPVKFCNRTILAVVLGCQSTVCCLVIVGMKVSSGNAPLVLELVFGVVMFVAYSFGVAYITSEEGPGSALGNLYYFTWLSFTLAFLVAASCFEEYQARNDDCAYGKEEEDEDEYEIGGREDREEQTAFANGRPVAVGEARVSSI